MIDDPRWYVIITRSRAEKKVAAGLERMGIIHFLPLQKQLKQWKDRKKWVESPLFPSYIFVLLQEQLKNELFAIPGISRFLSIGGIAAILKQQEIDRIILICNSGLPLTVDYEVLDIGDKVELLSGPLKGIKGILTDRGNGSKLNVSIPGLGCHLSLVVDKANLKRIE